MRIRALYDAFSVALWDRARIRLHEGKTRIWNAAGEEPPAVADLGGAGAQEPVWVGDWSLPPERQGLTVLGSPLCHDAFVALHLQHKSKTTFCSASPTSMICKLRGCCSSLALPPALTTCCVYCPRTSRLITQQTMIRPSHPAYLSSKPPSPLTVRALGLLVRYLRVVQARGPRLGPLLTVCLGRCADREFCPVLPLRSSRASTCVTAASMRRIGLPAGHPVHPPPRGPPRPLAPQRLAATRRPRLRQARVRDAPF